MHGDDLGVGVAAEEGQQVVFGDVDLVPQADDGGDADALRTGEADDGHADAAALQVKATPPRLL